MRRLASAGNAALCTAGKLLILKTARSGGGNGPRNILEPHERPAVERNRPGGVRARRVALARQLSRSFAARMLHRLFCLHGDLREANRRAARTFAAYGAHLSVAHL